MNEPSYYWSTEHYYFYFCTKDKKEQRELLKRNILSVKVEYTNSIVLPFRYLFSENIKDLKR